MKKMSRVLTLSLLALAASATHVLAQEAESNPATVEADDSADVVLRVDGLACPFCAYGLEQKLKALDAIDRVDVKLNEGEVFLFLKADETVEDAALTKAVTDAGFVVRGISRRTSAEGEV